MTSDEGRESQVRSAIGSDVAELIYRACYSAFRLPVAEKKNKGKVSEIIIRRDQARPSSPDPRSR